MVVLALVFFAFAFWCCWDLQSRTEKVIRKHESRPPEERHNWRLM